MHPHDLEWDAGDMGCGELLVELKLKFRELAPRTLLRLRALDPGAHEDIPAWCGLTGHRLVAAAHPLYWIQRKDS
jgi:tRNA 2-thiouridine synthesizing protein A